MRASSGAAWPEIVTLTTSPALSRPKSASATKKRTLMFSGGGDELAFAIKGVVDKPGPRGRLALSRHGPAGLVEGRLRGGDVGFAGGDGIRTGAELRGVELGGEFGDKLGGGLCI